MGELQLSVFLLKPVDDALGLDDLGNGGEVDLLLNDGNAVLESDAMAEAHVVVGNAEVDVGFLPAARRLCCPPAHRGTTAASDAHPTRVHFPGCTRL